MKPISEWHKRMEKSASFASSANGSCPESPRLGTTPFSSWPFRSNPYYGSFGYHVSGFYAVSSRFGTPEELQSLIDRAHGLGIAVLLDLVHSHAVKNTLEGLNLWDGTDEQYFHGGDRGEHVAWDSKLFNYRKPEVLGFLLSNVRYWLEDFHFDGFRFDGVTSMLFLDHGLGRTFGAYSDYFGANVDEDALIYLKLANLLAHEINPKAITVAEDVSGMPGAARPVAEGGLGFDFRLAMGVPDHWIRILKEQRDEEWDLGQLWHTLLNRRRDEKHVGYVESHDQSLVGDQTLSFRLMDQEMYSKMSRKDSSTSIDRGIALHKLIRILSFSLAGEAWLNFIGNEFGHPDWVDFPREGNDFSYQHARRQWSLVDNDNLRYRGLLEFDRALQRLDQDHGILESRDIELLLLDQTQLLLVYRRGEVVFAFNFHPTQSLDELRIPIAMACNHRVVLDSDELVFEGFGRVHLGMNYPWQTVSLNGKPQSLQLYLPARSCQALVPDRLFP